LHGVQGVEGSNPFTPTKIQENKRVTTLAAVARIFWAQSGCPNLPLNVVDARSLDVIVPS